MADLLPITIDHALTANGPDAPIYNIEDVPKEMDIYYRGEGQFLPAGKTWDDLTPEEMKLARDQYRFSPLKPGLYQTLTGMGGTGRGGM